MKYAIVLLFLALGLAAVSATSAQGQPKVTICHATGSDSNPYVEITVSQQSWESGHSPHAVHEGDYLGSCNGFISVPGTVVKPTPTCWIPEGCFTGTIDYNVIEIRSTGLIEHGMTEVRPTATPIASSIIAPPSDEPGRVTAFPNSGGTP